MATSVPVDAPGECDHIVSHRPFRVERHVGGTSQDVGVPAPEPETTCRHEELDPPVGPSRQFSQAARKGLPVVSGLD
jgi:hypothetical protein